MMMIRSSRWFSTAILRERLINASLVPPTSSSTSSTSSSSPPRLVFFGTDEFALRCLEALSTEPWLHQPIEVVCPPPSRRGRGRDSIFPCAVQAWAEAQGLPVHTAPPAGQSLQGWELPSSSSSSSSSSTYDLGVVASFGYFLPPALLDRFAMGCVNVHPSLLPSYRGAAPIHHALLRGEKVTGISIIDLHREKFDAGKIYLQEAVEIPDRCTYNELRTLLTEAAIPPLLKVLRNFDFYRQHAKDQSESPWPQSSAPKIEKLHGGLCWEEMTTKQVDTLFRALSSTIRFQTYVYFTIEPLTLYNPVFPDPESDRLPSTFTPGQMMWTEKAHWIACVDGWIGFRKVRVAKRPKYLSPWDMVNGFKLRMMDSTLLSAIPKERQI